MAVIASLKVNILGDSTALSNSLKQATDKMQAFGDKATSIGQTLSTRLTLPIVAFGTMAVKAASDSEETFSKFATVFRDVEHNADVAFKSLRDNYGLSSKASKQLLSDTGDLLTGFGFSQQSALELSTEVNKLAVDLASFTNFSGGAEGASQALTKALLGERDSIKSLGISIMEEDVQKRVAINTTKGLTFESERQAKAFATLQIAQEQSKNAIGDYARTQGGFANQFKLLGQRTNDLAVEFGTVLLPALTRMVGFMTKVTESLSKMDSGTKNFVITLVAFAAGIGPVIYGVGLLTSGIRGLNLAMAKNPYTAIAIGILAIASATYMAFKGVSDLEKALLKQAGIESLTGSEEERNKLLAEQKVILSDLASARVRLKNAEGDNTAIASEEGKIARYKQQLEVIDQSIAKSNALSWQNYELAKSAQEAADEAEKLKNGLNSTTTEVVTQAGSIGALNAELQGLQAQFEATGSGAERVNLANQITELEHRLKVLRSVLTPVTTELKMLKDEFIDDSDGFMGSEWDSQYEGVKIVTTQMKLLGEATFFANEMALQFTNQFSAGLANLIVHGGKLKDMLRNIGNLLASSALQLGIQMLLTGATGKGGAFGFIKGLFGGSPISAVPTQVMGAGMVSVSGQFKVQGTDLIAVINRSERQLR